jgi:hypothetical protein
VVAVLARYFFLEQKATFITQPLGETVQDISILTAHHQITTESVDFTKFPAEQTQDQTLHNKRKFKSFTQGTPRPPNCFSIQIKNEAFYDPHNHPKSS